MAKGDDILRRKRNKNLRKRLNSAESAVSVRIASIIAAKRRRKAGKRRICEGMCFSLPTPEDPFNDYKGKKPPLMEKPKLNNKIDKKVEKTAVGTETGNNRKGSGTKKGLELLVMGKNAGAADKRREQGCPSKLLLMCLNAMQDGWTDEGSFDASADRSLLVNNWGVDFLKNCYSGSSILDISGACATREKVAWLVSAACDMIARKEQQGDFVASPFLLFLVPTQAKALEVRSVCKALKGFGIHTVSLHSGAPLDHQVQGLKSCEPEFLISTPERLLELVSLKAIDISALSLLVIDGLKSFIDSNFGEKLDMLREAIPGKSQVVIFSDCFDKTCASITRNLVRGPVTRVSDFDTRISQSASNHNI